jgi:uncharacterized protein YfkK (UPF0435 family)
MNNMHWEAKITIISKRKSELVYINQLLTDDSLLWKMRGYHKSGGIYLCPAIWLPVASVITHILRTDFENPKELTAFLDCWLNPPIYEIDYSSNDTLKISNNPSSTLNAAKESIRNIIDNYLKNDIRNHVHKERFYSPEMYYRLSHVGINLTKEFKGYTKISNMYIKKQAEMLNSSVVNSSKYNPAKLNELRQRYLSYMHKNMFYAYEFTTSDIIAIAFIELAECLRNDVFLEECEECKTLKVRYKNYKTCIFCSLTKPERKKRGDMGKDKLYMERIITNARNYVKRHYGIGEEACIEHIRKYIKDKGYDKDRIFLKSEIEGIVNNAYQREYRKRNR